MYVYIHTHVYKYVCMYACIYVIAKGESFSSSNYLSKTRLIFLTSLKIKEIPTFKKILAKYQHLNRLDVLYFL